MFSWSQRSQRFPHGKVGGGVQPAQQRELQAGDVRRGVHHLEWNEQPVVEAPLRVDARWDASLFQQGGDFFCQGGVARGGVIDGVGFARETVVVMEHFRVFRALDCGDRFLPVRTDHDDRVRAVKAGGQLLHEIDHCLVTRVAQDGSGPPPWEK